MKDRDTKKNIFSSIILQMATIISGFVIPRIILSLFGSDTNGLVSSVNQFLNYIQLIEGGLGGVVMAALYGPLRQKDQSKVSSIINATSAFFRKIGVIYIIYLVVLALVYPLFVETGFGYIYSISLIIVLGTNLIVQYFFSISYKLLLNADRKVYVVSLTQAIITVINVLLVYVCSLIYKDILAIKIVSAVIFFIQPFVYSKYVSKKYNIDRTVKPDENALEQRWVAFGTNFAYFVHTNTDIIVLTILSSLANVSIYSVYLMIVNALKGLITAMSAAVVPSFGNALAGDDKKELQETFDKYEFVIQIVGFIIFTCGAVLIVPFVMIYTKGVYDANYNQPIFAILIILAEFFYCIREPYVQATSAAGMFKIIAPYAYIEAALNIIISILLVKKLGIVGVAIGTIVAMIFRMIVQIVIVNKKILKRSSFPAFFKCLILSLLLIAIYFGFNLIGIKSVDNITIWCVYACIIFTVCILVALCVCRLFYWKTFASIFLKKKTVD